jgi:hypothetical protein
VRYAHPGAVPTVQLASTMMPTTYGPKPRPQFKVISWKSLGGEAAPAIAPKQISAPTVGKKTVVQDIDDEIPF